MRRSKKKKSEYINYRNANLYTNSRQEQETNQKHKHSWLWLCLVLLLVGVCIGGYYYHQEWKEMETDIVEEEESMLPWIVVVEEGYEVNKLWPYRSAMDITTMRDTISPLTPQGMLVLNLYLDDYEVQSLTYQVLNLNATKVLTEKEITAFTDSQVTLDLSTVVSSVEESLLQITLELSDGTLLYYYTRVIGYGNSYIKQNLNYVETLHGLILSQENENLALYFAEEGTTSSTSLQEVTMYSGIEQIAWGALDVSVMGEVQWKITECTELFLSVQLEYQVKVPSEEEASVDEIYHVVESYRVGYSTSNNEIELKQYNRTMNQVFTVEESSITTAGFALGIIGEDQISYITNEDASIIAFVQEGGLFAYHEGTKEFITIFSLKEIEDPQYVNTDYDIHILSIDEYGGINFAVYGYMNQGSNQGEMGLGLYYYDAITHSISEKIFITTTQSFGIGEEDLTQGLYYSYIQNILYIMNGNEFYIADLTDYSYLAIHTNMTESNYIISDDGTTIAFVLDDSVVDLEEGLSEILLTQEPVLEEDLEKEPEQLEIKMDQESDSTVEKVMVLNMETGAYYIILDEKESQVMPLGFINEDFIYGVYRDEDCYLDDTGNEKVSMYTLKISDKVGGIQKTYFKENYYIESIFIVDNMLTMNLLQLIDGAYEDGGQDVITSNQTVVQSNSRIETYTSEMKQEQVRLTFGIQESNLAEISFIEAQMVESEDQIKIAHISSESEKVLYYAYAYGALQVVSETASDAIQYASQNIGAVINSDHEYVWRSGYRNLTFTVSNVSAIAERMKNGESAIDIVMEWASSKEVSYTGCTTEQLCFLINQGQVIAAKLENETWVMLVGYAGTTMYYLNENGTKLSVEMSTLDGQVTELIGDGRF